MGVRPAVRLRELADEYAALLRSALGNRLAAVVLHGPVARGQIGPDFSIDVLVVADPIARGGPFGRRELLAAADEALAPLLAAADMDGIPARLARTLCMLDEARVLVPLELDLAEDAVLLYDRDGSVARMLAGVRASLAAVGARRVRESGAWYWSLGRLDATRSGEPTPPTASASEDVPDSA